LEPAALAAYVRYGFRDREDGTIELACAPEVEARFFEAASDADGAKLAYAHLPAMRAPVTVASSTRTNLPEEIFVEQALRTGGAHHLLDGTHFFVQEDTARRRTSCASTSRGELLARPFVIDLPDGGALHLVDEHHATRALVARELRCDEVAQFLGVGERVANRPSRDHCGHRFAPIGVRHTHDDRVDHGRVRLQRFLDFFGPHLLAARVDAAGAARAR
jgi:hypothetical protein